MVFQNYALYPHMSVFDNMAYGLKIAKVPRGRDQDARRQGGEDPRARATCSSASRASSPAASASAWRWAAPSCASRRCSCSTSRCPTSTPSCARRPGSRSRSCTASCGITSLFVTHDQVEAMTLAQRMIVMNAGRMEQIGTPEEVYHRPATTFVASFIGSPPMNLLRGVAEGDGFTAGGQLLPLAAPAPRTGELVLGVRPEHVELSFDLKARAGRCGSRRSRCSAPSGWSTAARRRRCSPCASTRPRRIRRSATSSRIAVAPDAPALVRRGDAASVGA